MERSLYKRALQLGVLLLYLRVGGGVNQLGMHMFACMRMLILQMSKSELSAWPRLTVRQWITIPCLQQGTSYPLKNFCLQPVLLGCSESSPTTKPCFPRTMWQQPVSIPPSTLTSISSTATIFQCDCGAHSLMLAWSITSMPLSLNQWLSLGLCHLASAMAMSITLL